MPRENKRAAPVAAAAASGSMEKEIIKVNPEEREYIR